MEQSFINAADIMKILGVSRAKAYKIISELNDELSKNGYTTVRGKIRRKFFNEKFYSFNNNKRI